MTQSNDDIAIRVEHLGKRYRIGQRDGYKTLRESMMGWFRAKPKANGDAPNDFWALKDVNFEVKRGEVVGIIGRNGAGKSTLLKVLSRITEPTNGRIEITGRVGSLLEVGTGFHPELTGRENVFLNGAILGMREGEIRTKFDEIVAFAEIEQFIDTPVKRYSSGMYMRLAFAVAAHLEPEILIVDEVLAVGDQAFQNKCMGKMSDVASRGRTVLFVSHSMQAITRLCSRAVLLKAGSVLTQGSTEAAVQAYLLSGANAAAERIWDSDEHRQPGDEVAKIAAVRVLDASGRVSESIEIGQDFFIEFELIVLQPTRRPMPAFHLINQMGVTLFASADFTTRALAAGDRTISRCRIPAHLMAEGHFSVLAAVVTFNPNAVHASEPDAIAFQILDRTSGEGARGEYAGSTWPGVVRPKLAWESGYLGSIVVGKVQTTRPLIDQH